MLEEEEADEEGKGGSEEEDIDHSSGIELGLGWDTDDE